MHVITGVGNEAVIGAMACVAYPEQAMYAIPAIDKEFPVYYLPMGKENPNGDIKFSVRTEGDHTYIEYQADDPTKPAVNGPHNYDIEKLPMETIPEVPADSHVYITGNGQFPLEGLAGLQLLWTLQIHQYAAAGGTAFYLRCQLLPGAQGGRPDRIMQFWSQLLRGSWLLFPDSAGHGGCGSGRHVVS